MPLALLLLFSALTFGAFAAERTATLSGDWAAKDTWDGQAPPGEGDSASVKDGVTVTVSDARTLGLSGPPGTSALALGASGAITVVKGGSLRVRGDVVYSGGKANTRACLIVEGGGTFRWDSSKAATPASTQYRFYPSDNFGFRPVVLCGTPEARAVLDSDPAGAAGCFSLNSKPLGGPFTASFADISRIGDVKTPGWELVCNRQPTEHQVSWNVRDCSFTHCGLIKIGLYLETDGSFRHCHNVHEASAGPAVFSALPGWSPIGKGVRELLSNVFDIAGVEQTVADHYTICGNYFGGGFNVLWQSEPWAKCEGNFYRIFDQWCWVAGRRIADCFVLIDRDWINPHVMFGTKKYTIDVSGLIFSHGGTNNGDSGEWIFTLPGCQHCIFLPNIHGYSTGEITASGGGFNGEYIFEHNTWFGGKGKAGAKRPGFAALQYSESGNNKPGQVKSFRSNILWNPQLPGKEAAFCKMNDCHSMTKDQKDGPPVEDVGDPVNIDHNTGWNYTPDKDIDFPNKAKYKNASKGYIGNWSKTPGEHDQDVDPQFVDYKRDVQLFATQCLGVKPSCGLWQAQPEKAYAIGDTVLHSTAILWGQPVLYRYLGGGKNPEPGGATSEKGDKDEWRKSWEWASLHVIRQAIASGQKFGDDDVLLHLIKWIRAGYAPTNPKLRGAAHDGSDIGAVPWQAPSGR